MPRKPYAPGTVLTAALLTAAGLAAGLTGCSSGSGEGPSEDPKSGEVAATAPAAEPGKYGSLPEPCGAVGRSTLRTLLPGLDDDLEADEREAAYEGEAAITFDTDRRVGCRWTADSDTGTRHLSIDFERVVSYDPEVSDDDRAQQLYDKKAEAADIPEPAAEDATGSPSETASGSKSDSASPSNRTDKKSNSGKGQENGKEGANPKGGGEDHTGPTATASGTPSASGSELAGSAGPEASLAPRSLEDLADTAYLNDRLTTADSGVHRDVTVVFRSSNVIVTVEYDQWSTTKAELPLSEDLQRRARRLAQELSGRFDD
ncbi:hypothetical protein AB0C51_09685 [Streptomyces pathocidini]|uniref:hypothetical protein n=1 Tax=Streptomyces pathocidini TaxID=1650571 RepID=UPI0033F187E4